MAQVRKTRQQKIKQSQRRQSESPTSSVEQKTMATSSSSSAINEVKDGVGNPEVFGSAAYQLVAAEIKKISIISLICFGLLAVATLLISDLSGVVWLRESLGLPSLF